MTYTNFQKLYKISQFAQYQFGDKVTLQEVEKSVSMIVQTMDTQIIKKFLDLATKDFSPLMTPQFKKEDDKFIPTPNRPKTPNELLASAYKEKMKRLEELEKSLPKDA